MTRTPVNRQDPSLTPISGWGRTPVVWAEGEKPRDISSATAQALVSPALPRGLGRSYGDASLPTSGHRFRETTRLDRFISFDPATGLLEAEAGVTLDAVLKTFVPRGWCLPVTPGTRWVTLGGAVASNVHGKNHHLCGSIEHFIEELEVATPVGLLRCGPQENRTLFRATVGGYGLTGLITRIALRLKPIASPLIRTRSHRRPDLSSLFEAFREHDSSWEYSVAWVDTLTSGSRLGRGVLHLGNHASIPGNGGDRGDHGDRDTRRSANASPPLSLFSVPFSTPSGLLQPWTLRLFNETYYRMPRSGEERLTGYGGFFYPLDIVENWNRLYGSQGFFQYQCVIPDHDGSGQGEAGVRACLEFLTKHGMGSFLAVLKRCGDDTPLLPFCRRGFTLALDIPHRGEHTLRRLDDLDRIVLEHRGRVYLTKDARLSRQTFRAMYPEWSTWMDAVKSFNPEGVGRSRMSERLGLWGV